MQAKLVWKGGVQFEATSDSGHTVILDGAPEAGGENAGARPMELLLLGVGGCASYDVVTILKKSRQNVLSCVTQMTAERAPEPPRVFTQIAMHFVVTGSNLSASKVARAVTLSAEKFCSASIMLGRAGVAIEHTHEIVESTEV